MWYVYFLRSESNLAKVYTGYTKDLDRRLEEHNNSENNGWTKRFQPWRIEAYVICDSEETAQIVEAYFKNSSGLEKFKNFAEANSLHPNPKQGFFDTLEAGRGFGRGGGRFNTFKHGGVTMFIMKT